tara:strand:- start:6752 stop:9370 length:2619 start_codon:yes stop_codon:yes gene_type:complete
MSYLKDELYQLIKKEESVFDFIQEAALDGLWYWDLEKPENEWMNPKFWKVLGYNPEEMPHSPSAWQDIIHPEDLGLANENFKQHCADPKKAYDQIVRYFHKEGHIVWIRCRGLAIRDQNGKPYRMLGAHNEVTALKEKERLLLETNRIAQIGYWEVDLTKSTVHWSEITREIHEVPDDYKPNVEEAILFYKEGPSRDKIIQLFKNAIETGEPYDVELELTTFKGHSKWIRTVGLIDTVKGKCSRIYGLFQDIDERVRLKHQSETEKKRYQQIIAGANLGSWELNLSTNHIGLNSYGPEILGFSSEEFKDQYSNNWILLIHPDDQELFEKELKHLKENMVNGLQLDLRLKHKTGDWLWLRINAKLFKPNFFFSEARIVGTFQDITSEKEANKRLYTFILDAPMALAMLDKEMRYISCSKQWLLDYKLDFDTIKGKSHYTIFPALSDDWKAIHQRCIKGETLSSNEDLFYGNEEEPQWIKWKIKPWYQTENEIGGIIIYTEDITSQKVTEGKLLISEVSFRENFENSAIGMAILDAQGQWVSANNKLCSIVGYSLEELREMTFENITHPEDLVSDLEHLEKLRVGEIDNYQIEKRYIHKKGHIVHILLGAAAVRNEKGEPLNYISQIVDISKRKIAENRIENLLHREQERTDRLNNFAHIVSHNLRTHSSGISKLLDFLELEHPSINKSEAFKYLHTASEGLSQTIDHLNQVVEIQGATKESFVKCNLKESLESTLSTLRLQIQNSKIQIHANIDEHLNVKGLEAYLESIFFNFISNAIKYRDPNKSAELTIKTRVIKNWICISFIDNGLGIDLERHKQRLFGMYNTFHNNPEARGLGLFLTENQVRILGGRIEVSSIESKGSEFKVYLPYEKD